MEEEGFLPILPAEPTPEPVSNLVVPVTSEDTLKTDLREAATSRTRLPSGDAPIREGMGFFENISGSFRNTLLPTIGNNVHARALAWPDTEERKRLEKTALQTDYEGSVARKALKQKDAMFSRDRGYHLKRIAEDIAYNESASNLSAQSVAGTVIGNMLAPENLLIGLPAAAQKALGQLVATRLPSAGPAIQKALMAGADAAFGNVVTDPLQQALNIERGAQQDYSIAQTALAAPIGFAAGGAFRFSLDAASGANRAAAPDAPRVSPDAAGVPEGAGPAPEAPRLADPVADVASRVETPAEAPTVARGGDAMAEATVGPRDPAAPVEAPRVDVPEGNALALNTRSAGEVRVSPERLTNGEPARLDAEALPATRRVITRDVDTPFIRQILDGETQKPVTLPRDATPEDVHAFRITEAIGDLAAQLGRKVEVDNRFTARGAAGEYKLKDGVIRLRQAGDFETFAHEAGHAIDIDLRRVIGADWDAAIRAHAEELRALDANTADPASKTVVEGVAEFLRAYVTNPRWAEKNMAPNFFATFERLVDEKAPEFRDWFDAARRASQIDSGMDPVQRMQSMVVSSSDMPAQQGGGGSGGSYKWTWREIQQTYKKQGLWVTMETVFDHFKADFGANRNTRIEAFTRALMDRAYKNTGNPFPNRFTWADPRVIGQQIPAANQVALDQIHKGIRPFGSLADDRVSPGITDALRLALGDPARAFDLDDVEGRGFAAYLIARRAQQEYVRFRNGDILKPPVRATEREVIAAIADYEARFPRWRQAADMISEFNRALLQKGVDAGIEKPEIIQAIAGTGVTNYVPLSRDFSDMQSGGGAAGGGKIRSSVKRFSGSSRDIINPLERIVQKAIALESMIVRNRFYEAIDKLGDMAGPLKGAFVERVPNTEIKAQSIDVEEAVLAAAKREGISAAEAREVIRESLAFIGEDTTATIFKRSEIQPATGERLVFYYRGGERVALKFGQNVESRALFEVMEGMGSGERDMMLGMLGRGNAYFSAMVTTAPSFMLGNMAADGVTRAYVSNNTGVGYRVASKVSRGFYPALRGYYIMMFNKEFARQYAALGGMRGGVVSQAAREANAEAGFRGVFEDRGPLQNIRDIPKDALAYFMQPRSTIGQVGAVAAAPAVAVKEGFKRIIRDIVETSETAGRLAQADAVYKYLKKQGLSDAEATVGYIFESKAIMDYDQVGAAMGGLRRFMSFLNPSIQGLFVSNQRLIMDPARAVRQWEERGRDWSKVDAELQEAFRSGLIGWSLIAAGVATMTAYHSWVSDHPAYLRNKGYMTDRYYIVPYGFGENDYFTLRKPFDLAGAIFTATERTLSAIKTGNPDDYSRARTAMIEAFVPRQFTGVDEFVGSNPFLKTGVELVTGRTIPFAGGESRDIVPERLQGEAKPEQFTARTSAIAMALGEKLNQSPIMIDHAISSLGATIGRDTNDMLTAMFGQNPNMSVGDAAAKIFFGNIYRRTNGIGEPQNALMRVMARDGGTIVAQANSFRTEKQEGRLEDAQRRFNNADDLTKTMMVLRGNPFTAQEKQFHPLERADTIRGIVNDLSRDLSFQTVRTQDRSLKAGQSREYTEIDEKTARAVTIKLQAMGAEDIVSGLKLAGVPGYANMPVIDTSERVEMIKAMSPEVGKEFEARLKKAHVRPIKEIEEKWPEVQRRLLRDQEAANFSDLYPGVKPSRDRR